MRVPDQLGPYPHRNVQDAYIYKGAGRICQAIFSQAISKHINMDPRNLNKIVRMAEDFEKMAQLNSQSGLVMDVLKAAKLAYQQGRDVLPSWLRPDLEKVRSAVRVFYGAVHAGNTKPQELSKFLGNVAQQSNALASRIQQNEDNPYADQTAMTASQIVVPYLNALSQFAHTMRRMM